MSFANQTVMVTGGTGALGRAVVGALLAAGARCHVPFRDEGDRQVFQGQPVTMIPAANLADEALVKTLYAGLPALWASIHIAGGFAFAPLAETTGEILRRQIDDNLVSCFLCCREAVGAMRRGKAGWRIVNVAARQALEPRTGANISAYTAAKAGV